MSDSDPGSGISIVCVFNNPEVRRDCLDRSIDAYAGKVTVEFVPVDNTEHVFTSAGAALNHGARQATQDVVVFVHQDVYLHSIDRIAQAATELLEDAWGMLGANGMTSEGTSVGRLRDRVQLIGDNCASPTDVDSLDEVLFMVRRDRVLTDPLTEDEALAWHAYAVEYGLRLKSMGLRVGALNLAVTHNSLTINLDRLDVAHRRVAELYPGPLPIATTCGRISQRTPRWRQVRALATHGWRVRWLRESRAARRLSADLPVPVVLVDIRHDVDLLTFSDAAPIHLLNLDDLGGFAEYDQGPLRLLRRGRPVIASSTRSVDDLRERLADLSPDASWLVTNVGPSDLAALRSQVDVRRCVAGVQGNGTWLAGGPLTHDLPEQWGRDKAVPLGTRTVAHASASRS